VFTLFAAPIGDFLMPTMMRHTSDFTVAALRVTGIPVYREGLQFVIPSGRWSVVEACSGLRYLIASMVLGCLFAYLSYRSLLRRAAFIAASIVTPIVANWLRAYMIVMIGHYSGMKLAVGVDHLIYGWIFFGIVMLALFWIGSFWREDRPPKEEAAPQRQATLVHRTPRGRVTVAALAVALLTAAWPLFADRLEDSSTVPEISLVVPAAQDWMLAPAPTVRFQPHYTGARARFAQSYVRGEQEVGVFVGYYAAQGEGTELINFHNSIVPSNDLEWHKLKEESIEAIPGKLSAIQTELKAESRVLTVWNWYWVGGYWTSSLEEAKLLTALNRLVHRRDDAAIVIIYTSTDEKQPIRAAQRLGEFTRDALPGLGSMLEKARSPLIRPASAPGLPLPLGAVVQPKAGA
jgi:EpsI family protein